MTELKREQPDGPPIPTPEELIVTVATLATELMKRAEEIKRLKATIKRQKSIIKATADDRQIEMFRDELRTQAVHDETASKLL